MRRRRTTAHEIDSALPLISGEYLSAVVPVTLVFTYFTVTLDFFIVMMEDFDRVSTKDRKGTENTYFTVTLDSHTYYIVRVEYFTHRFGFFSNLEGISISQLRWNSREA